MLMATTWRAFIEETVPICRATNNLSVAHFHHKVCTNFLTSLYIIVTGYSLWASTNTVYMQVNVQSLKDRANGFNFCSNVRSIKFLKPFFPFQPLSILFTHAGPTEFDIFVVK